MVKKTLKVKNFAILTKNIIVLNSFYVYLYKLKQLKITHNSNTVRKASYDVPKKTNWTSEELMKEDFSTYSTKDLNDLYYWLGEYGRKLPVPMTLVKQLRNRR